MKIHLKDKTSQNPFKNKTHLIVEVNRVGTEVVGLVMASVTSNSISLFKEIYYDFNSKEEYWEDLLLNIIVSNPSFIWSTNPTEVSKILKNNIQVDTNFEIDNLLEVIYDFGIPQDIFEKETNSLTCVEKVMSEVKLLAEISKTIDMFLLPPTISRLIEENKEEERLGVAKAS